MNKNVKEINNKMSIIKNTIWLIKQEVNILIIQVKGICGNKRCKKTLHNNVTGLCKCIRDKTSHNFNERMGIWKT